MKNLLIILFSLLSINAFCQKQDTSTYILAGKLGDFQLLYMAIKSPQDITPRQDTLILRWLETARGIIPKKDSTKK